MCFAFLLTGANVSASTASKHPSKTWPIPPTTHVLTKTQAKLRARVYHHNHCLASIIDMEDGQWDPTISNGGGHGDTSIAYGLPQADPGSKMAYYAYTVGRHKAGELTGADWRTNADVQLSWQRNYAVGRYGSFCGALQARLGPNHSY